MELREPKYVGATAAHPAGAGTTEESGLLLETCQSLNERQNEKKELEFFSSYLPVSCHCLPLAKPRREVSCPRSLRQCTLEKSRRAGKGSVVKGRG